MAICRIKRQILAVTILSHTVPFYSCRRHGFEITVSGFIENCLVPEIRGHIGRGGGDAGGRRLPEPPGHRLQAHRGQQEHGGEARHRRVQVSAAVVARAS